VGVSVAYPLPGTKFHDLVSEQLGEKTHWRASGELAMMFPGTYTTPFYRAVRDLLHDEVRLGAGARRSLRRRWDRLLARQESFLNTASGPATAAAPAVGLP
jgi:anaerobic magnesium-protoporphyrin IX monomethyl ester cyclase